MAIIEGSQVLYFTGEWLKYLLKVFKCWFKTEVANEKSLTLPIRFWIEPADKSVAPKDWQTEISVNALLGRHVALKLVIEAKYLLHPLALNDAIVKRRKKMNIF